MTFESSKVGRDISRDLARSRLARANFRSPGAQFLGFRRDRPPSAPFWAAALGIRQLHESFFASFQVFGGFEVAASRKFRKLRSFRTFEAPKAGRDICIDLGRSRLAWANFLSPDAQFLGFRRDRPPSAPFRAAALGIRQLPESFFREFPCFGSF